MRKLLLGIDFDGTITDDPCGRTMNLSSHCKWALKELRGLGCELILWTCRHGESLERAKEFLLEEGLLDLFLKINDNAEDMGYPNCRKILVDAFVDDKNLYGFSGWKNTVFEVKRMIYRRENEL